MTTKKNVTYTVYFRVKLDTTQEVSANSLEQALEFAKSYQVTDCITIQGEHNDSSIQVTGVQAPYEEV